jgi:hypothetical protein
MANLEALRKEVDELDPTVSSKKKIMTAFQHIEDALKGAADGDLAEISGILTIFRDEKLPPDLEFNGLRASAKDLDEALKLGNIAAAIAKIQSRNDAVADLTAALGVQSKKATKDAKFLSRITFAIEKADKTVSVVKDLIDGLEEADKSTRDKLKALVDAVNDVSSIFKGESA